jgi:phage tail protein X
MRTVYAHQSDTLDALCWRELGATTGVVETVYELNRGLAALGPILPHGTPVVLPDRSTITPPTLPTIQLWD